MRWASYFVVSFLFNAGWFATMFVATKGNRTDNGDVCDSLGASGEYSLSFEDWSCDPAWPAIAFRVLLPTFIVMIYIAALGETVRWAFRSRKRDSASGDM